ncbi:MAG TPA: protein kinase [Vicinamibacterales bacterium]|jgi:eukaryotic-like serine/threonine-protein kinase|nr:protein kinase [Vicinamibacterales bacterium]
MTLPAGTRLGSYEVVDLLGAGGMGEVYRARDTRLKRDVALKILPASFASDPERLARFQREAEVLASLDHPHIAAIYGIEDSNGTMALVLQLVDGETLADRIARGSMPFDEALPIARQIAEALEAAHEQGVIHRDLKPANVKITPDGVVKVLDFGLAKLVEQGSAAAGSTKQDPAYGLTRDPAYALSQSPTITTPALMTGVGMLLGTAAYMSPEQAKGRPADKRSDIWAFGCVLYEMLTGKRAFSGEDVADTLAFVLTKAPEWSALPAATPAAIRRLLRRALDKDRRRRLADASNLRLEIDDASASTTDAIAVASSGAPPRPPAWRLPLIVAMAVVLGALIAGAIMWRIRPTPDTPAVTRFAVTIPDDQQLQENGRTVLAISPDGSKFVYAANGRLYLRSLSGLQATPIAGTETPQFFSNNPVFSPDGEWIAFVSGRPANIRKVRTSGGAPVTVCEGCGPLGRMDWTAQGIIFGQAGNDAGLPQGFAGTRVNQPVSAVMRVSPDGGEPQVLFDVRGSVPWAPQMLPDETTVLFTLLNVGDPAAVPTVIAQSLVTGERKTVVDNAGAARYVSTGHLLYAREGVLFARRFDPVRLESGEAVPVLEGVRRPSFVGQDTVMPTAYYDVSLNGSSIYVPGSPTLSLQRNLAMLDGNSRFVPIKVQPRAYDSPRVSPDSRQLAVGIDDGRDAQVWVYDLAGANPIRQLTQTGHNRFPVWSPDSRYIVFQSDREGDLAIFRQRADGSDSPERLSKPEAGVAHAPDSWSPDGGTLLVEVADEKVRTLWGLRVSDKTMTRVGDIRVDARFALDASFSPDGRWLAYRVDRTGTTPAIAVEPYPPNGSRYVLADSFHPVWSRDGKTLWSRNWTTSAFVATPVITKPAFAFGTSQPLSIGLTSRPARNARISYDITRDAKIVDVIATRGAETEPGTRINVVLNWLDEVARLVPPSGK